MVSLALPKTHAREYTSLTMESTTLYTETMRKVREFYASSEFRYAPLVEGATEGVRALRQLGFRLVIVTARSKNMTELTENLVRTHFPGASNFCPSLRGGPERDVSISRLFRSDTLHRCI